MSNDMLLTYDQISRIVRVAASLGIGEYRLTGGEPLMRPHLEQLIASLSQLPGVRDIALTTNGMLLSEQLDSLASAGLRRVNISLDTLHESTFQQLSRRSGLYRVMEGIEAAMADPRVCLRLNALVLREVNFCDVTELVQFARARDITIRFIEFMPLDAERSWNRQRIVSGAELRSVLGEAIGPLTPAHRDNCSQPSIDYEFPDGSRVGFIDTVSNPFCGSCDRLRLTADGKIRNCLFGQQEWDVKKLAAAELLGSEDGDEALKNVIRACVAAKAFSHGMNDSPFVAPSRSMYQIGG